MSNFGESELWVRGCPRWALRLRRGRNEVGENTGGGFVGGYVNQIGRYCPKDGNERRERVAAVACLTVKIVK